jgi:hypothetical protein
MDVIADHDHAENGDGSEAIGDNIYNRWLEDVALVTFR